MLCGGLTVWGKLSLIRALLKNVVQLLSLSMQDSSSKDVASPLVLLQQLWGWVWCS
jgi:hypothetical protein